MKHILTYILSFVIVLFVACRNNQQMNDARQQNPLVFPQGEKITNENFMGTAYLKMLVETDSLNTIAVGNVTFEPGARSKWHMHPCRTNIIGN